MAIMLLATASAAAMAFAQPQQSCLPVAHPALWQVSDADTTIFLFGTFHALDGRSEWFNDEVGTAFAQSDELILETVLPKLDEKPAPRTSYGVASSASFLGATRMAMTAGRDSGLDVRKGADMILRKRAEEAGKPVTGLESVEFQLGMLSRMAGPKLPGGATVASDPRAKAHLASVMTQMQASWNRGDQTIFTVMLDQMRQASPENYRVMFPERNAHWADWIANRMDRPGTIFVAVGAGHFAGPDSVLAKLSSKGFTATRLD